MDLCVDVVAVFEPKSSRRRELGRESGMCQGSGQRRIGGRPTRPSQMHIKSKKILCMNFPHHRKLLAPCQWQEARNSSRLESRSLPPFASQLAPMASFHPRVAATIIPEVLVLVAVMAPPRSLMFVTSVLDTQTFHMGMLVRRGRSGGDLGAVGPGRQTCISRFCERVRAKLVHLCVERGCHGKQKRSGRGHSAVDEGFEN